MQFAKAGSLPIVNGSYNELVRLLDLQPRAHNLYQPVLAQLTPCLWHTRLSAARWGQRCSSEIMHGLLELEHLNCYNGTQEADAASTVSGRRCRFLRPGTSDARRQKSGDEIREISQFNK